jgi:hypothetical protein
MTAQNISDPVVNKINELDLRSARHEARTAVNRDVIAHILREVTSHLGISAQKFDDHFCNLRDFYHAKYLDQISKDSKESAALIDDRPQENVWTGDSVPSLFSSK